MESKDIFYAELGRRLSEYCIDVAKTRLELEKGGTVLAIYTPNNMKVNFTDPDLVEMAKLIVSNPPIDSLMSKERLIKKLYAEKVVYEGLVNKSYEDFLFGKWAKTPKRLANQLKKLETQRCVEDIHRYRDALETRIYNVINKISGISYADFLTRTAGMSIEDLEDNFAKLFVSQSPKKLEAELDKELKTMPAII